MVTVLLFEKDVQDPPENYEIHDWLKIDLIFEFFLTLIGNGLCLVVINYEQFGGDPMKRGIENKLISSVCVAQILGMFSSAILSLIRALYGPVNIIIVTSIWFILGSLNHFASLTLMLMFLNKNLNILAFNFVSHVEENFWFLFLQILNLSLSIILVFIIYFLSQISFPLISLYAGFPITSGPELGNISAGLMALGAFIMILSYLIVRTYKNTQDNSVSPVSQDQVPTLFNNLVHNPNILNDRQLVFTCTAFIATCLIPLVFNQGLPPDTPDALFLEWLPARWLFGFINPMLFFYFNPAIGEHFKRDFWDNWAPGCLDKYNPYLISLEPSIPMTEAGPSEPTILTRTVM